MSGSSPNELPEAMTSRTTLLIVFIVVFVDLLGFGIVIPLLPRYGRYFQASHATLGLLMASFSAMQFLFAPMWGSLSDRIGRRAILLVGLLGSTFSYLLFGLATHFGRKGMLGLGPLPWLFISRIGAGIFGATIATAQAVIADSTGTEGRGRGMAMIGAAFGIGFTFGPLIGAAATSDAPGVALTDEQFAVVQDWTAVDELVSSEQVMADLGDISEADQASIHRYLSEPKSRTVVKAALLEAPTSIPGYVAAVLSFLALLFAWLKLPESWKPADREVRSRRSWLHLGALVRHLKTAQFAPVLISIFITTFAFAQLESTMSLLTKDFGYGDLSNFVFFAYIGFILLIGQGVLVRRLLPSVGEQRMAVAGVALMMIGFWVVAAAGSGMFPGSVLWYVLPVITIGFSAVTPSLQSLLSQAAASTEQGAVFGTGQSLSSLARIVGPYMGVQLLAVSTATPYYFAAGLMLLGGIQVVRLNSAAAQTQP